MNLLHRRSFQVIATATLGALAAGAFFATRGVSQTPKPWAALEASMADDDLSHADYQQLNYRDIKINEQLSPAVKALAQKIYEMGVAKDFGGEWYLRQTNGNTELSVVIAGSDQKGYVFHIYQNAAGSIFENVRDNLEPISAGMAGINEDGKRRAFYKNFKDQFKTSISGYHTANVSAQVPTVEAAFVLTPQ